MSRTTRTDRSASWKTSAGALASSTRFSRTSWSLKRYCSSRSKSSRLAPCAAVRMIAPPPCRSSALASLAQAVALLVLQALGDADALAGGRVDHVAPGDGQLHRQARALGLERVLDDLHDDLLAGLEQVGDLLAPPSPPRAPAARDLDPGQHDLVDVQEAVLVQADVDEGGLEAGQDVVDPALVDVADDRPGAAALEVELGDAVAAAGSFFGARLRPRPSCGGRGAGRLQQRDAGLPAVDADEHLLLHVGSNSIRSDGEHAALGAIASRPCA